MKVANILAYYDIATIADVKSFVVQALGIFYGHNFCHVVITYLRESLLMEDS